MKLLQLAIKLFYYLYLDRIDRARFNLAFYKNYSGSDLKALRSWESVIVQRFWEKRLFPKAVEQIKYHKREGHKIFIITGTLGIIVAPLANFLEIDGFVAAEPEVIAGKLTGKLLNKPISGATKREAIIQIATTESIDLSRSFAYGDSQADLELLAAVSYATVVNPNRRLKTIAEKKKWQTVNWQLKYLT